eukprot:COSAG02_NODE_44933_length_361_cov_1.568702_1_plen_58_part_10
MIGRNTTVENIGHRMPEIHEIFCNFKEAQWLSAFDAENGYWNVSLTERSKRLCAFGSE